MDAINILFKSIYLKVGFGHEISILYNFKGNTPADSKNSHQVMGFKIFSTLIFNTLMF